MDAVAKGAGLQRIEVYEVASFYSMFNLHPVGTYVLDVCHHPLHASGQRR
jgi:NADH-quinone oxidoreductase subunit E